MGGVKGMDMVHLKKAGQLLLSRNSKLNPDKTERIPGIIGIGMGVSCSYNEGIPFFSADNLFRRYGRSRSRRTGNER